MRTIKAQRCGVAAAGTGAGARNRAAREASATTARATSATWQVETGYGRPYRLRCNRLISGYDWFQFRLFRNDDPGQDICDQAGNDSSCEHNEKPQDAD